MSHPLITKAIQRIFSELNKQGIHYAVLRKVEFIPENIGNDIDILIRDNGKLLVLNVIRDCAKEFGFKIYERQNVSGLYPIFYQFADEKLIFFRLDFTNPVKNPEKLLGKRIKNERGIYYLPAGLFEKKKKNNFKNLFNYPKRFLFPGGGFVVIVGPDGVGKSTTAELVRELLEAFHIPVTHMHLGFRPRVLPTKKKLTSFGKEKSVPAEESKVPGPIRFFYHSLDYFLGYYFKIRPLLVKGRFVIGERYYYSYLVDPRPKKRYGVPDWLLKLTFLLIPKPNVVVLLSNEPAIIYKRRQEHSVEEISRQLENYRKIGKKAVRFFEIKTNEPASEVAMKIVNQLISSN